MRDVARTALVAAAISAACLLSSAGMAMPLGNLAQVSAGFAREIETVAELCASHPCAERPRHHDVRRYRIPPFYAGHPGYYVTVWGEYVGYYYPPWWPGGPLSRRAW
jgi:hypothetical protein